jgi:hypothetical protein
VPAIRRRIAESRNFTETGYGHGTHGLGVLARSLAPVFEAGVQAGDDVSINGYIARLRTKPPSGDPFFEISILMPLWRRPDSPKMAELARWLFLANDSPRHLIGAMGVGAGEMITSPLVGVPTFREVLKRELGNVASAGTVEFGPEGDSLDVGGYRRWLYVPDIAIPKPDERQPIRVCDFYAWKISELEGSPRYEKKSICWISSVRPIRSAGRRRARGARALLYAHAAGPRSLGHPAPVDLKAREWLPPPARGACPPRRKPGRTFRRRGAARTR